MINYGWCIITEIIEAVAEKSQDEPVELEHDDSTVLPAPTYQEFMKSINTVKRYLESKPGIEKLIDFVYNIEDCIAYQRVKQRKLTDFFNLA